MNLSLDQKQEMLKQATRELVAREYPKDTLLSLDSSGVSHDPNLWRKVASVGWLGILIPEKYGGESGSLTDAAVIFQELGQGPVPGPYFSSSILGTLVLLEGGSEDTKREFLPKIATGQFILSLGITESDYIWEPGGIYTTATTMGDRVVINGSKVFVQDVQGSTHVICTAKTEGNQIILVTINTKDHGVAIRPLPGFTTGVSEITLDNVQLPTSTILGSPSTNGWTILQSAIQKAIPIMCAYQVGGCEKVLEMTLAYSKSRIQFGMPIGRFQRVQDHIIDMVNQTDAARWVTYEALWKLDTGRSSADSVHMAKAITSDSYYHVCNSAHEVHAGVGIMKEYGLPLHTKMSRTLYHYLGDPRYHKRRLAEALNL